MELCYLDSWSPLKLLSFNKESMLPSFHWSLLGEPQVLGKDDHRCHRCGITSPEKVAPKFLFVQVGGLLLLFPGWWLVVGPKAAVPRGSAIQLPAF